MAHADIIKTLRSHGIAVDGIALESALSDPEHGPAFADWARRHLNPDTLLTADELDLYAALESRQAEKLAASSEPGAVLPLGDDEIKTAIEELHRSTETISQQTEILQQQQEALARLIKRSGQRSETRADADLRQLQKWEADRQHLTAEVEELSQTLDLQISELEQQEKASTGHLQQTVDALFHSDDKLLAGVQKLGWELDTEDPEEQASVGKLRETCARLIKYTVETTRTKLDRLYLEALEDALRSGGQAQAAAEDVAAVREELESLYTEILPVAQMSVEHQHLGPALKSLASKNGQKRWRSLEAVNYIDGCMSFLLGHMDLLAARVEAFKAHQAATSTILATARAELAAPVPAARNSHRHVGAASPTRRRKSSAHRAAGSSPMRGRATPGQRRRSSGTGFSDLPPLDQLLQTLALLLPQHDESTPRAANDKAQALALASALADRSEKTADVGRNVQESFESAASSQVYDTRRALQMVRDSVLAESPFGDVKLVDPEIEGSIDVLAQEVEKVRLRLAEVETGTSRARGRSIKRDELVARWGR